MDIDDFEWDDDNSEHIGLRGITEEQVDSLREQRWLLTRNKRSGSGDYRIIGRDSGGRLLTVIIAATSKTGVWRPITGWYSNEREQNRARNHGV